MPTTPLQQSKILLENFKNAFEKADEVVLLPIYSAGEKDIFGVTIEDLQNVKKIQKQLQRKILKYR